MLVPAARMVVESLLAYTNEKGMPRVSYLTSRVSLMVSENTNHPVLGEMRHEQGLHESVSVDCLTTMESRNTESAGGYTITDFICDHPARGSKQTRSNVLSRRMNPVEDNNNGEKGCNV